MFLALTLSLGLTLQEAPERRSLGGQEIRTVGGIFDQVHENWNVHCTIPGIRDIRFAFDIELAADGSIVGQPVLVRSQNTPAYRAAAEGARRALLNSAPFDVPEGYEGGAYRPTFVPGRVCSEADED